MRSLLVISVSSTHGIPALTKMIALFAKFDAFSNIFIVLSFLKHHANDISRLPLAL